MKTAFAASTPRQATFIVYINGIEVPAKSVSMRYGVWQVPEMQIDMVADPTIIRLGAQDRVQVVVFYLDDTDVTPEVAPEFRVFGEGEITGWGYRNTSRGRMISFTVINQMAVFTQLFTQFLLSVDSSLGPLTGQPQAGLQPSSSLVYPFSLFTQGLLPTSGEQATFITRPFDFLYNAVRGMISSKVPPDKRTIPAANFFTRWARLTNFHNRFVATPYFDQVTDNGNVFPVLRALQNTSAIQVIANDLLPNIQNAGSFWDMLQAVFSTMFMEIAMIPGMPLVTVDLASGLVETTDFGEHKLVRSVRTSDGLVRRFGNPQDSLDAPPDAWVSALRTDGRKTKPKRIANYFAKPQMLFSIPPSCNALFPSQIMTLAYEENYATQPTRMYFNDESLTQLLQIPRNGIVDTMENALSVAYPFEADLGAKLQLKGITYNGKNFLLYPEEYFKGPVMDRRPAPSWLRWLRQAEFATGTGTAKTGDGDVAAPARPAQNAADPWATPTAPTSTSGAMQTSGRVGKVAPSGQRVYGERVEKLRPMANRAQANSGIPADFLLAWVSHESDGKLETVTHLNERGYFQIMGPHVDNGVAKTLAQVEAGSVLGLTLDDTGTGGKVNGADESPAARLSRDSEFSFAQGVRLVGIYRQRANKIAVQKQLNWAEGDMWRLTKLYHNAPALIASFVDKATAALGYPPPTWEEMHKAISAGLTAFESNMLQNATAVGGVVAGASGQMTTASDPKAQRAPSVKGAPAPGEAASTRLVGPTEPTSPTIDAAAYEDIERNNLTVHQLYAKYEYFRERYAKRAGSAVLTWNPYVVAGFPTVLFDQRASRVDVVAYVTTVQQVMSHEGQRSTTISFLYGRQLQEMFNDMANEFDAGETASGSAPAEPVRDVRKIVQSFEQAESFYQRMFYGAQRLHNKDAAFDFRKVIGYAPNNDSDTPETIFINGPDEATQDSLVEATRKAQELQKKREGVVAQLAQIQAQIDTLTGRIGEALNRTSLGVTGPVATTGAVLAAEAGLLNTVSYDYADADAQKLIDERAMLQTQFDTLKKEQTKIDADLTAAYATIQDSQNTTGLRQVQHNLDGARELVPLPAAQTLFESRDAAMRYNWRPICTLDEYIIFYEGAGEGAVPAFGHPQSVGARYFDRIRRMRPPGEAFTPPPNIPAPGQTSMPAAGPDFPQTRDDWDEALLAYRNNVLAVKAPRT